MKQSIGCLYLKKTVCLKINSRCNVRSLPILPCFRLDWPITRWEGGEGWGGGGRDEREGIREKG